MNASRLACCFARDGSNLKIVFVTWEYEHETQETVLAWTSAETFQRGEGQRQDFADLFSGFERCVACNNLYAEDILKILNLLGQHATISVKKKLFHRTLFFQHQLRNCTRFYVEAWREQFLIAG